jgi:hypothetical protein
VNITAKNGSTLPLGSACLHWFFTAAKSETLTGRRFFLKRGLRGFEALSAFRPLLGPRISLPSAPILAVKLTRPEKIAEVDALNIEQTCIRGLLLHMHVSPSI